MAKTITLRRKGYKRKGYTATRKGKKVKVSPARVKPSTFKIRDRGKAGRGPKVVPPLEKGLWADPISLLVQKANRKASYLSVQERWGRKR